MSLAITHQAISNQLEGLQHQIRRNIQLTFGTFAQAGASSAVGSQSMNYGYGGGSVMRPLPAQGLGTRLDSDA